MKTCVIFNPTARGEKAEEFRGFLEQLAGEAAFRPTWAPGAATELAKGAVEEGFENIVAAGGDGTLNEVLNGMALAKDGFKRSRLGVLPLGTVNVFAKELRLPERPQQAWETIMKGNERTIDLPFAEFGAGEKKERRYFAQLAGAGLDAEAIALVDWETKRKYRQLAYVWAGYRALFSKQKKITVTGGSHAETGELVLIGNGRYYGGKLPIFPDARLDDGKLDVAVFRKVGLFTITRLFAWMYFGRLGFSNPTVSFQTDELTLSSESGTRFEVEGDLAGELPATIGLREKVLRVICGPAS